MHQNIRKNIGKKGLSLQFNWIFVMIAGAVILGFFFSLIWNQAGAKERQAADDAASDIESLFKTSLGADGTTKVIDFGKKMEFSCEDGVSEYFIAGSAKGIRYDYSAVFSPSVLESDRIVVSTRSFSPAFKVMPVLFVSDSDQEYVFVRSAGGWTNALNEIYSMMPQNLTKSFVDAAGVAAYPDKNYDRTIFIVDKADAAVLSSLLDDFASKNKVAAIIIDSPDANTFGSVEFFNYSQSSKTFVSVKKSFFFGKEMLFGAVVSSDAGIYECQAEKMVRRMNLMSKIYEEKLALYSSCKNCESMDAACGDYYAVLGDYLSKLREFSDVSSFISGSESTFFSEENFKGLYLSSASVDGENKILVQKTGCPSLY